MGSVEGETTTVRYTVKELFEKIDRKLDSALEAIDGKASAVDVDDLAERVADLEKDRAYAKGVYRAAWAIVVLLIAIAGLLVPIVVNVT